jgi:predicted PurR-regulated permease PerM
MFGKPAGAEPTAPFLNDEKGSEPHMTEGSRRRFELDRTDTPPATTPEPEPEPLIVKMPIDVRSVALSVLATLGVILVLRLAKAVLIPIVIAMLLSFALSPVVGMLKRWGVPRGLGAGLVLLLLAGGTGWLVYSVRGQAMALVEELPRAAQEVRESLQAARRRGEGTALDKVQKAAEELEQTATEAAGPEVSPQGVQRVQVVEPPLVRDYLWLGGVGIATLIAQIVLILFLVFFLLLSGDLYRRKLVKIVGPSLSQKKITVQILDEINLQIERFLVVRLLTSTVVGVATWLALWVLGVEGAAIWGLAAGIFNTIPYFGPAIVSGAVAVVSYLQFGSATMALYASGITLAITGLEGWLITPPLMGRAGRMNEVAIFVGLLFWTWIWGIWGTILAVPMMMVLKAICDRVEDLQPVGELLGS